MNTQTHEEWLASLKPGDEVAMHHYTAGYQLERVKKVTSTGRITLENGDQYRPDGTEITSSKWGKWHLAEPTPEVLAKIKRVDLISAVHNELERLNINCLKLLSDERLEELLAVLRKHTGEES